MEDEDQWWTDAQAEFAAAAAAAGLPSLELTCAVCPVQVQGFVGDLEVYFRERNGEWYLSITDRNGPRCAGACGDGCWGSDWDELVSLIARYVHMLAD